MKKDRCLAGRLLLPLLFLGGNVLAMDESETAARGDDDWSIVSAPPPPGPYRSVNIDPRIPGQDAVSVPGPGGDFSSAGLLPAEALRLPPPAAGGAAPEPQDSRHGYRAQPSQTGGYATPPRPRPLPRDHVPAAVPQDYAQPPEPRSYAPPGPYDYAQPGRDDGYRPAPYARDYVPPPQDYEQPMRPAVTFPSPGMQEDYVQQPVPGQYGRSRQRPQSYNNPWQDGYARQPEQQGYRMMPPPGYYQPSIQRPLQEVPQPPIYDSRMGQPSGVDASQDAYTGVPR